MDIFVGILLGLIIGSIAVCFYVLGLTHGRKGKDGLNVKLEPIKAIVDVVDSVKNIKQEKIDKEASIEFNNKVKQMWEYNGVNK